MTEKGCITCAHATIIERGGGKSHRVGCTHPVVIAKDGRGLVVPCIHARHYKQPCGTKAKLWKERPRVLAV